MTFLPIVERELRVASRRRGTYWLRCGVALAVIGIGTWIYVMARRQPPAETSIAMFIGLTIVCGLFCLFAGARATADCLSEEKRDGTLGLLFLTDLRGFDVVVGKLVASSLNTFYGLIACLPMLAIPILMGGVTASEFWRMALVLLNTMFFSLAAGMLASALTKSARNAAGLCMFIVLGIAGLLPLMGVIIAASQDLNEPNDIIGYLLPSPGYAFTTAFEQNYRGNAGGFWTSLILVQVMAWIFLGLSCLIVPRSWQDKAATVTQLRWRDRWLRWSLGNSAERATFRARLLDVNAFYWLVSRSRIKPAMVWAVIGVIGCGWIWGWLKFGRDWINPGTYIVTALLLNTLLKGWFAGECCAQIAEDRRIGAMELLLSTPLNVREILHGQYLALCRQFLWPLLFVVALEICFVFAGLRGNDVRGDEGVWIFVWVSGLIMLFADLAALFYVSLWQGLTARSANRANTAAMVRILALPWILFGIFLMLVVISLISSRAANDLGPGGFVFVWLVIGLIVDAIFGFQARNNLETRFRDVATTRYTQGPSFWKRLFGTGNAATRDS